MRRYLYRLIILNFAIFLVTTLVVLLARQVIDPHRTPYQQIRKAVVQALDVDDPERLEAQLERLRVTVDSRMSVYSPEGELLASTVDPPLALGGPDFGLFGGYVDVEDEAGEVVARVALAPPLTSVFRQTSRDLLIAWIVVCGLALLVVIRATRRMATPLETLVDAARRLGSGDLDARAGLVRTDEIGEVGHAFDEMAARMSLLLRSQRELLANVSHEFRTPLARMRLVSEMLAEGDDVRELLPELDTDLAELTRLVERVLESATLDLQAAAIGGVARPTERSREHVGGAALVDRVVGRFGLAHPERVLERTLESELPEVHVELDPVLRAFDNLLENAHRYGGSEAIRVRARVEEGWFVVDIIDRGIGIAAEDLPLIFSPFFRADRSRARHTGGLGLGLGASRSIVEAQGGELRVHSVLGEGSCFSVRLPGSSPM